VTNNGFLLNASKTQAMIMGIPQRYFNVIDYIASRQKSLPDMMVGGTVIQFSTHVRYLGITISNNFS